MSPLARRPERASTLYRPPWRIDIVERPGVDAPLSRARLAALIAAAMAHGGAPRPAAVGLILSDDAELGSLNEEQLGRHGPTDVLSFPLLPPGAFPEHAGQDAALRTAVDAFPLPPGVRVHLGEIVVSVERALAEAEQGRGGQTGDVLWSVAEELRLLVVHGTLHLCGWDHALPEEEAAMRALERRILGELR
ncbi:hypothetical protein BH20CHL6_BH20CHL6_14200 [soil metagenome]